MNSKPIKLGGASLSDYRTIDVYDYLLDAFNPNRSGEIKRYLVRKVTLQDLGEATRQARLDSITLITSTNEVQRDVWNEILLMKEKYHLLLLVI